MACRFACNECKSWHETKTFPGHARCVPRTRCVQHIQRSKRIQGQHTARDSNSGGKCAATAASKKRHPPLCVACILICWRHCSVRIVHVRKLVGCENKGVVQMGCKTRGATVPNCSSARTRFLSGIATKSNTLWGEC